VGVELLYGLDLEWVQRPRPAGAELVQIAADIGLDGTDVKEA